MVRYLPYNSTRCRVGIFSFSSNDLDTAPTWTTSTRCGSATAAPLGRSQYNALLPRRDGLTPTTVKLRSQRRQQHFQAASLATQAPSRSFLAPGPVDAPMPSRMVVSTYPNGLTWRQSFHECMIGSIPEYPQSFFGLPSFLQQLLSTKVDPQCVSFSLSF